MSEVLTRKIEVITEELNEMRSLKLIDADKVRFVFELYLAHRQ